MSSFRVFKIQNFIVFEKFKFELNISPIFLENNFSSLRENYIYLVINFYKRNFYFLFFFN
jgi:hypothetical protein